MRFKKVSLYVIVVLILNLPKTLSLIPWKNMEYQSICKKVVQKKEHQNQKYNETYWQPLEEVYKMQRHRINYKIKDYPTYHIEEECCEGFKEVDNKCVPDCSPRCENGSCVAPNICECFPGYAITTEKRHVCKPICTNGCLNGECVQPEVCICSPHYFLDPDGYTCHPTCYDKCDLDNGYCSGPNTCSCHIGYKKSNKSNICEPICERDCINGKCVEPDLCSCNDDYELDINDSFNCIPKCEQTCLFGRCTAPNVCTCNEGYEAINGTHCKPICTKPCKIGICVAPDICIYHKGYSLIEENDTTNNNVIENLPLVNCDTTENNEKNAQGEYICQLICDINCEHGSCEAPNVCICNEGYRKNEEGRCVLKDICTNIQCKLQSGLDDINNNERYKPSKKIDGRVVGKIGKVLVIIIGKILLIIGCCIVRKCRKKTTVSTTSDQAILVSNV